MQCTSNPSSTNWSHSWRPMKPVAPVTRMRDCDSIAFFFPWGSVSNGIGTSPLPGRANLAGERAHPRGRQIEPAERAQKAVADEHVNSKLGLSVKPGAEPREAPRSAQERIEVAHLDADRETLGAVAFRRLIAALDADTQKAVLASALPRDQQAAVDPPGHAAEAGLGLVLRSVKAEERQAPGQQHRGSRGLRVDDADEPEGDVAEPAPVGAGKSLEILGFPHLLEQLVRNVDLGLL